MYFSPLTTRVPVRRFREEVDRLLSDFLGGFGTENLRGPGSMPANVWEDKDNLYVEIELPGVREDKIDLSVSENALHIEVDRQSEEAEGVTVHRRERSEGQTARSIKLPTEVNADEVTASLVDGVLTVTLPKSPLVKPRKIKVRGGDPRPAESEKQPAEAEHTNGKTAEHGPCQ